MTDFYFRIIINDSIIENKKRNERRNIASIARKVSA